MPLNRPNATELLEAVREYLLAPVEDARADKFYRRVVANMVATVERQWSQQADFERREQTVLARLLEALGAEAGDDVNAALCRRLEAGVDDAQLPGLIDGLEEVVQAKLAIDHPGYSQS